MIPLSQVSFSFADGLTEENMEKVEKEILPQFQNLEGVAGVSLYGKVDPRIVIQPDKKKMEKEMKKAEKQQRKEARKAEKQARKKMNGGR